MVHLHHWRYTEKCCGVSSSQGYEHGFKTSHLLRVEANQCRAPMAIKQHTFMFYPFLHTSLNLACQCNLASLGVLFVNLLCTICLIKHSVETHKNDPSQSSPMTHWNCVAVSVSADFLIFLIFLLCLGCFWASMIL